MSHSVKYKNSLRQKRVWRIRKKVAGTAERPRLVVHFSNKHIYAQCIDDVAGRTLVSAASTEKALADQKLSANVESAIAIGKVIGEKAKAAGLSAVVFDRNGRRYHGSVKAFADAAREAGLEF
jgi:large subunit ribosomal protein L18